MPKVWDLDKIDKESSVLSAPNIQLGKMLQEALAPSMKSLSEMIAGNLPNISIPTISYPLMSDYEIEIPDIEESSIRTKSVKKYVRRHKFGLKILTGGNFKSLRKTLKNISLDNTEGKFLGIAVASNELYIEDKKSFEEFHTQDLGVIAQIVSRLRDKFRNNRLLLEIKRQGKGYIILSISPLQ